MDYKKFKPDFKDILQYCEKRHLYLGEGNPNSQILIIGKEIGHGLEAEKTPSITKSNAENELNLTYWRSRYESNYLDEYLIDITNKFQEKSNSTWANYQKIINSTISEPSIEKKYDFLNYSFITELSQIHLPYSHHATDKKLINARLDSVQQRKEMFKNDFFQNFPIAVMACGHYPTKDFNFDIETTFDVKWDQNTIVLSKGNYLNIHYGKTKTGSDKILIHTRQASLGVTNELLDKIGSLCKPYYN